VCPLPPARSRDCGSAQPRFGLQDVQGISNSGLLSPSSVTHLFWYRTLIRHSDSFATSIFAFSPRTFSPFPRPPARTSARLPFARKLARVARRPARVYSSIISVNSFVMGRPCFFPAPLLPRQRVCANGRGLCQAGVGPQSCNIHIGLKGLRRILRLALF